MKKKDKLKETARPKTWIWEAYFHLFFLVIHSFMFALFFFAQRNGKRHAFSFSLCLIMALFRSALLYGASPEPCTGPAEQPGGLPRLMSTLRRSHRPLLQTAAAKCSTNVTCFNKCSQTANAKAKPTGTAAVSQTSARTIHSNMLSRHWTECIAVR